MKNLLLCFLVLAFLVGTPTGLLAEDPTIEKQIQKHKDTIVKLKNSFDKEIPGALKGTSESIKKKHVEKMKEIRAKIAENLEAIKVLEASAAGKKP